MEYIKRHAEATVNTLSKMFGAILVAGPRQVGKTTMLQRITEGMNYATLDDLIVRAVAQEQSGTFFKDNPPPVFVDEIQKAPELFSQIKMFIDREHKKGSFSCAALSSFNDEGRQRITIRQNRTGNSAWFFFARAVRCFQ